ncbi:hypothetical protein LJB84_01170 [Bacteroidales bacterium OttesenSCG-928-J19]|nr:hypothetical protein [Bacteroidales bacterium OttesenSCG-928-J19]
MKRFTTSLLLLTLYIGLCFSQKIEVLNKNEDFSFKKSPKEFYFISPDLEESKGTKVADLKFYARDKGKRISLVPVFYNLWKEANKLGANSFFVSEVSHDPKETRYDIIIELYYLNEEEIEENLDLYPENLIVIIGNVNTTNRNKVGKEFKLNDEDHALLPFEYLTYQNEPGNQVILKVGGAVGGAKMSIIGETGKLPQFFSIEGTSITPAIGIGFGGGIGGGIAMRSGSISQLDMNLGLFLMRILK